MGIEIASLFSKPSKENGVAPPPPFQVAPTVSGSTLLCHPLHCQLLAFLRAVEQIEID